jgi:putative membrane protein
MMSTIESFIIDGYLYIRAFHIISIISWMAGLLYLPRIFVYHTKVEFNSEADKLFQIMEKKLLKIIMLPALIASLISGLLLIQAIGLKGNAWLHTKLVLLMILVYVHHLMAKHANDFAGNCNSKSERYFRVFNEVPAVLMVLIVCLAVIKFF